MKRVVLFAIAVVLSVPASARADATVDGSKGQTIQAAVDAAAANSAIEVLKGTYAENVSVPSGKDNLTLKLDPGAAISGSLSVASSGVKLPGLVLIRATGTDPALSATGGKLSLTDATVLATGGDAISITGADNVVQRSTILTTATADGADGVAVGAGGLRVDSSIVVGGSKGAAVRVTTTQGSDASTVTLNHVTSSNAGNGIVLEGGNPSPTPVQKVGDITLAVNASIIHGASTANASAGVANPVSALPPLVASNAVKATYTNSDATAMTKADGSTADPTITGGGNPTADSALFRAKPPFRLKFNAPVIDKGGPAVSGESDTDIDGDKRTNGAATDIGADEFTNHAPTLDFALTPTGAKSGQIVTATATATDQEGADDIIGYSIDWGDGHKDTTKSNVIQHVYDKSGTYTVTMLAADQSFATSPAVTKTLTLADGTPPQLQVTTPAQGASVKLTHKKKKGAKKAPKPKTYLIKGVDADESGLTSIELAITKTGSKCQQYNGSKLVSAGCTKYTFVKATLSGSGFSLKAKNLKKGSYEIRARGTDTKGNVSSGFDKTVKTLVAFKVK